MSLFPANLGHAGFDCQSLCSFPCTRLYPTLSTEVRISENLEWPLFFLEGKPFSQMLQPSWFLSPKLLFSVLAAQRVQLETFPSSPSLTKVS